MTATALSNYQLGDLLGRGASGNVYRALNFHTGETVAIKSISLLSLPPSSLPDIMSEIDLLKNLNHTNIVKYKGFARDKENLWIILEYCENGSLQTILKKFGKFPESLVAVYIRQVLEGLIYLHEQGVIHRDIKGANILTNKDGSVKLADFGVSSRAPTAILDQSDKSNDGEAEVVGSPYWMAPEVIEQSGASTASDIWSVGCVVVELLEGKPPYGDLAPMQALWRIVQDESMRIPEGASPIVKDFLYHCFQKDPNLRISAKKLLRHPWMLSIKKSSSNHSPITPSLTNTNPDQNNIDSKASSMGTIPKAQGDGDKSRFESGSEDGKQLRQGTIKPRKKKMTVYDEAVQRVQEWNEALKATPKSPSEPLPFPFPSTSSASASKALPLPVRSTNPSIPKTRQRGESNPPLSLFSLPPVSKSKYSSSSLPQEQSMLPPLQRQNQAGQSGGLLSKNIMVSNVLERAREEGEETWDDDFAEEISFFKFGRNEMHDQPQVGLHIHATSSALHSSTAREEADAADQKTVRQNRALAVPAPSSNPKPKLNLSRPVGEVEDYSDMEQAFGEDEGSLEKKLRILKLKAIGRKGLMHPDDIHKYPLSPIKPRPASRVGVRGHQRTSSTSTTIASTTSASASHPRAPLTSALLSSSIQLPSPSPPTKRSSSNPTPCSSNTLTVPSLSGTGLEAEKERGDNSPLSQGAPNQSSPSFRSKSLRSKARIGEEVEEQIKKYTEDEDEDYDDIFGGANKACSSLRVPLKLSLIPPHSLSSSSTLRGGAGGGGGGRGAGAEGGSISFSDPQFNYPNFDYPDSDEEDMSDPFAEIEDEFDTAEDLEKKLMRDKKVMMQGKVSKLVDELMIGGAAGGGLRMVCDDLLDILGNSPPNMGLEAHFVAQHGLIADVIVRLLKLVNLIVTSNVELLESFCLIGGIPVIIPYTSKKHSLETRLGASTFIRQLTRSALTLQMFISCRGLRILVELLDEDYALNKTLILSSLEGISSVFELQSPTPRNDFVRMFVREGVIDPLSTALLAILKDKDENRGANENENGNGNGEMEERQGQEQGQSMMEQASRAVGVLLFFCQVAQADARVREAFATRTVMMRLLKACDLLPRKLLVTAIKSIKHLSTSPQLIEVLQNSNAMEILVDLLGKSIKGSHSNEICSNIFQTIYSMTRLSKSRQEEAASSGIIPLLKRVIQSKSPLKQFALPILCDMANAGKGSRRLLWQNDGLGLYLDLLEDPYWRVSALDAISAWMQDETARVEDVLLEKFASDSLVRCFVQASGVSFEGILDPLLKILRLSTSLTSSLSHPPFFSRLSESLERSTKAVVKLNLLRLTKVVCECHPDKTTLVERFGLAEIVERLSRQDGAVLVRELAKEILPGLLFGSDARDPAASSWYTNSNTAGEEKVGRMMKSEGRKEGKRSSQLRRTLSENVATDDLHPIVTVQPYAM
uniref:non-specific serine/threonine protein kinase n=1 Tax=Cryptococcus bacillisporus CA1280 TaxID=1296109 RepID=A0A0D0UFP4_CRYGA|nr:STE/STE11/CDC15 protein kinase [Cryptococcus bacillisporus CA1280]